MHFTAVLINSGYLPVSPYKSLFDECKGTLRNLFSLTYTERDRERQTDRQTDRQRDR